MALLRGAVARAEQAGVSQHSLVEARQYIVVLEERLQAASALEAAIQHGDTAVLRLAVARAERAGVEGPMFAKAAEALDTDADADKVSHASSHASSRRSSHPCIIDCPGTPPVSRAGDAIDATDHRSAAVVPFGVADATRFAFDGAVEVVDYDGAVVDAGVLLSMARNPLTAHGLAQVSAPAADPPRPPSAGSRTAWEVSAPAASASPASALAALPPRPPSAGSRTAWEAHVAPLPQPPDPDRRTSRAWAAAAACEESSDSEDSTERAITNGALRLLQAPPPTSCSCLPYARLTDDALAVLPAQAS